MLLLAPCRTCVMAKRPTLWTAGERQAEPIPFHCRITILEAYIKDAVISLLWFALLVFLCATVLLRSAQ